MARAGRLKPRTARATSQFVWVPAGTPAATCQSCHATVYWIETPNGRRAPIDCAVEGGQVPKRDAGGNAVNGFGISHFGICPNAAQHRRRA